MAAFVERMRSTKVSKETLLNLVALETCLNYFEATKMTFSPARKAEKLQKKRIGQPRLDDSSVIQFSSAVSTTLIESQNLSILALGLSLNTTYKMKNNSTQGLLAHDQNRFKEITDLHQTVQAMVLLAFVRQNNKAVSMIDCEQYSDAIKELSKALICMKNDLGGTGSQYSGVPKTSILDQCLLVNAVESSKLLDEITKLQEQGNDQTFLYNQAIRIPPALEASCQQNTVDFAGIVIFNLALAHHLVASVSAPTLGGTQVVNFQKALTFYSLIIRVQSQANVLGQMNRGPRN
eukprot:scaffold7157_cov109-Cylindrotheca_fusiformis.AAC.1